MAHPKSNLKRIKDRCRARKIPTITRLAELVGCSRPAIYFALENPSRFSRVHRRIMEVLR